jgi:hypothetical protein
MSSSISNLAAAFVAVAPKLKNPAFDSTNPHFKNDYASLSSHLSANRDTLATSGLAIIQTLSSPFPGTIGVRTMLLHSSGEFISSDCGIAPAKSSGQEVGSLTTYLRRYSLAAVLGIVGDSSDDDGESDRVARSSSAPSSPAPRAASNPSPARPSPIPSSSGDVGSTPIEFGKHKGKTLSQVLSEPEGRGWIEWASNRELKLAPDGKPWKKDLAFVDACRLVLSGGSPGASSDSSSEDDVPF